MFFAFFAVLLSPAAGAAVQAEEAAEEPPPHSNDEIQEAEDEFKMIDTNSDGFITREEILEMQVIK